MKAGAHDPDLVVVRINRRCLNDWVAAQAEVTDEWLAVHPASVERYMDLLYGDPATRLTLGFNGFHLGRID